MYDIKIQSPFVAHPVPYPGCSSEKALSLYREINWEDLYSQIEATGSSPESPFYYFEIYRQNHLGEKEMLCVSGGMWGRVGVEYRRPKMETRGFFKKKEVLNPEFSTQMDGMDTAFAFSCMEAFVKGNTGYLEQHLHDREEEQ